MDFLKKHIKKIIIAVTGIAILAAGIAYKQEFFLMIPLFISLFVMSFQSEANRIGPLLGAINSLIYTAAYLYMGIYLSAVSAVLFSFPFQLMTFIRWSKNAYKKRLPFWQPFFRLYITESAQSVRTARRGRADSRGRYRRWRS